MRVSFRLEGDQIARATGLVEVLAQEAEKDKACCVAGFDAGNLLGYVPYHGFSQNENQRLKFSHGIVTYVGERSPLIQDGGCAILAYIVSGYRKYCFHPDGSVYRQEKTPEMVFHLQTLVPLTYITRMPSWGWFECLHDQQRRLGVV